MGSRPLPGGRKIHLGREVIHSLLDGSIMNTLNKSQAPETLEEAFRWDRKGGSLRKSMPQAPKSSAEDHIV